MKTIPPTHIERYLTVLRQEMKDALAVEPPTCRLIPAIDPTGDAYEIMGVNWRSCIVLLRKLGGAAKWYRWEEVSHVDPF